MLFLHRRQTFILVELTEQWEDRIEASNVLKTEKHLSCGGPARVCCARAFLLFLGSAVAMLYFTNWCVCV